MRKGSYSEELVKDVDDTVNLVTPVALTSTAVSPHGSFDSMVMM